MSFQKRLGIAVNLCRDFRQFVRPEPAAGAQRGNSVFFNRISNISNSGGTLVETSTIPQNNYTISQGTLTMTEYGNSVPYTQKLQVLSEITVPPTIQESSEK